MLDIARKALGGGRPDLSDHPIATNPTTGKQQECVLIPAAELAALRRDAERAERYRAALEYVRRHQETIAPPPLHKLTVAWQIADRALRDTGIDAARPNKRSA